MRQVKRDNARSTPPAITSSGSSQPFLGLPSPLLVGPDRLSNYASPVFVVLLIKVLYVKQDQPCG